MPKAKAAGDPPRAASAGRPRRVDLSDDRAWLDGFRRGEERALERVFRTYSGYVVAILARGTRVEGGYAPGVVDVSEQADLLQEVFVKALQEKARLSYDGLRPYGPFLAQMTRHVLIDHHRRRGRELARHVDVRDPSDERFEAGIEQWTPSAPLPDAALETAEDRDLVQAFLRELPPEDRLLIELRFVEGRSQEDTAAEAGQTRQRIRTWELKIRERFRSFMREWTRP